jgi:predicted dehydrogenase
MIEAAIIGLGRWGQRLVDSVQGEGAAPSDAIRFVRAATRSPAKVAGYAARRGLALGADYGAILSDPAIAAVVLATPHTQHAEQIAAAAKAGKHVFCDKPLTMTRASAAAAAEACRRHGVVLAAGFNRRFLPAMIEMKRMIAAGELGTVMHLEGNFSGSGALAYAPGMWRADPGESPAGGMTGMGIHVIDAFIHLAGPIASVRCESRRLALKIEMDDTTHATLRFASGASGYIGTVAATGRATRVQIFGSKGWAHMSDHETLDTADLSGAVKPRDFPKTDIERRELEAFAAAIAGKAAYPVAVEEAIHGVAVMEACLKSATKDGERVEVETA